MILLKQRVACSNPGRGEKFFFNIENFSLFFQLRNPSLNVFTQKNFISEYFQRKTSSLAQALRQIFSIEYCLLSSFKLTVHFSKLNFNSTTAALMMKMLYYFSLTGIHPQSQAAYEMLSEGVCRPVETKFPIVYSLKCIEFNEPYFTLGGIIFSFLLPSPSQINIFNDPTFFQRSYLQTNMKNFCSIQSVKSGLI